MGLYICYLHCLVQCQADTPQKKKEIYHIDSNGEIMCDMLSCIHFLCFSFSKS